MPRNLVRKLLALCVTITLMSAGEVVDSFASTALKKDAEGALTRYTAEYRYTMIGSNPDGTTTRQESTLVTAVDAQGRSLQETITPSATSFRVLDPAAHTSTEWSSTLKRATVHSLAGAEELAKCAIAGFLADAIKNERSRQNPSDEDLGTRTIAGIEAHGTRTTSTEPPSRSHPTGSPFVTVIEHWSAVDAALGGLSVRESTDYAPRHSGWIKELISLRRGDPDATLFTPPADYETVKEAGGCELKNW